MRLRCMLFFFSSRRRHTRFDCDWSSDVCSSDLQRVKLAYSTDLVLVMLPSRRFPRLARWQGSFPRDEIFVDQSQSFIQLRSEERRVGKSVDLGGRRIIKKKKNMKLEKRDQ